MYIITFDNGSTIAVNESQASRLRGEQADIRYLLEDDSEYVVVDLSEDEVDALSYCRSLEDQIASALGVPRSYFGG